MSIMFALHLELGERASAGGCGTGSFTFMALTAAAAEIKFLYSLILSSLLNWKPELSQFVGVTTPASLLLSDMAAF